MSRCSERTSERAGLRGGEAMSRCSEWTRALTGLALPVLGLLALSPIANALNVHAVAPGVIGPGSGVVRSTAAPMTTSGVVRAERRRASPSVLTLWWRRGEAFMLLSADPTTPASPAPTGELAPAATPAAAAAVSGASTDNGDGSSDSGPAGSEGGGTSGTIGAAGAGTTFTCCFSVCTFARFLRRETTTAAAAHTKQSAMPAMAMTDAPTATSRPNIRLPLPATCPATAPPAQVELAEVALHSSEASAEDELLGVAAGRGLFERVRDGVPVRVCVLEGVASCVEVGDSDAEMLGVDDTLAVCEALALEDAVSDAERVGVRLAVRELDGVLDRVTTCDFVWLRDRVSVWLFVSVCVSEGVCV
jgi:hypothetical protein